MSNLSTLFHEVYEDSMGNRTTLGPSQSDPVDDRVNRRANFEFGGIHNDMTTDYYINSYDFRTPFDPLKADAILKPIMNKSQDRLTWDEKSAVLELAMAGFGSRVGGWFSAISMGKPLRRNMDFLVDTVSFIQTGRRNISVQNWRELLWRDGSSLSTQPCVVVARDQTYSDLVIYMKLCTTEAMLCQWCAQPKGFQDMVCTLDILFGSSQPRNIEPHRDVERLTVRHSF